MNVINMTTIMQHSTPFQFTGSLTVNGSATMEEQTTSILLPPSLFNTIDVPQAGIFFSFYETPVLFPLAEVSNSTNVTVSSVVSATVAGANIQNLADPVIIVLKLTEQVGLCEFLTANSSLNN